VATETPSEHLAWALGILNSAISLGTAAGPATGALAAGFVGLRVIFVAGGALLLLAAVPVLLFVRESPGRLVRAKPPPTMEVLRAARPGTLQALVVLMVAQALQQTSFSAAQQLVVLRLLDLTNAKQAQFLTGITFAIAGIATALAAVTYSRLLRRSNYRTVITVASVLMGLTLLGTAVAGTPALLILAFVISSFVSGSLIPAFGAMTGLESPRSIQATVFGVGSSAIAVGFGLGPLIGGFVASAAGVQAGLAVAGGIGLALAVLVGLLAREPTHRPGPPGAPTLPSPASGGGE
jgi:DHA1 family multidrug resistance protein-like MFS transporter